MTCGEYFEDVLISPVILGVIDYVLNCFDVLLAPRFTFMHTHQMLNLLK